MDNVPSSPFDFDVYILIAAITLSLFVQLAGIVQIGPHLDTNGASHKSTESLS